MNKEEFLQRMQDTLKGEVSDFVIKDNISYYKNYIENEISNGKTEKDVLDMLGDPRLLSKTIIEMNGIENNTNSNYKDNEYTDYSDFSQEQENKYSGSGNGPRMFTLSGIRGCLVSIAVMIIVLIVFALVLQAALYLAVPIAIILIVGGLIRSLRK